MILLACSTPEPLVETPVQVEPVPDQDPAAEARALAQANQALGDLKKGFKGRLSEVLPEGGPVAAVAVCSTEAQALTAALSASTGGSVGRSSLKLRNPENEGPRWVREWLESADADSAGLSEVVDGNARVLKPVLVEPTCLSCHGSHIDAEVAAILAENYPEDAATGYGVGDLRGAMWAEVPVR